jgi:ABC-type sugar transport system ATPase subunit
MSRTAIECQKLVKRFLPRPESASASQREGTPDLAAVDGVDLSVESQTTLAIVGPSGCGKTTLLRLIAGFEHPESGTIDIGSRRVVGPGVWLPPESREWGWSFRTMPCSPIFPSPGTSPTDCRRESRVLPVSRRCSSWSG